MSLHRITAADALARLAEFDTVIDARSEGEFALDRSELGTNLWYRPSKWLDAGATLRIKAIRSAGPQSLIGIDGDSLLIRLA